MDKKQKLEEEKEEEHYWEPYRPYQQPVDPDTASGPKEAFPEEKTEVPQKETAADDQV